MIWRYTDAALIEGLRQQKNKCVEVLYKELYPVARSIVEKNSGSQEEVKDVLQDGLTILFMRATNPTFTLRCSLKTFFYAICKNIWLKRLERKSRLLFQSYSEVHEAQAEYTNEDNETEEENLERVRLYQIHFFGLSNDCQKLLTLFCNKTSLKEIANIMGFKTEKYAKTRKFMCKNQLRKKIMNDPRCKYLLNYE